MFCYLGSVFLHFEYKLSNGCEVNFRRLFQGNISKRPLGHPVVSWQAVQLHHYFLYKRRNKVFKLILDVLNNCYVLA